MSRSRKSQPSFLTVVDSAEREVARLLTLITGVVIFAALVQLVMSLGSKLLTGSEATWLGDDLIKVLGDLLTVLIALEVLQNITSYLRRHVVQIELVLVTALTAVARKVIVLPSGAENKPQLLTMVNLKETKSPCSFQHQYQMLYPLRDGLRLSPLIRNKEYLTSQRSLTMA